MKSKPPAAIEKLVRSIVRGQLRSFCADHPEALERKWIMSIEKRISNTLMSPQILRKIGSAIDEIR
jgi:hypothetical protein